MIFEANSTVQVGDDVKTPKGTIIKAFQITRSTIFDKDGKGFYRNQCLKVVK